MIYLKPLNWLKAKYSNGYNVISKKAGVWEWNPYLITNYAEDVKLQDEIKSLPLKLVPKTMLPIMLRNQAIY